MTMHNAPTPGELGYRWPAEWEPHESTWLAWPHNRDTWPGVFESARWQYIEFAKTIAAFERVNIIGDPKTLDDADSCLGNISDIALHEIPTNDAWIRDHGPIFLKANDSNLPPALVDWQYNAWGNKYPPFDLDNDVPQQIANRFHYQRFQADLVLEGGSVDGNGRGIVLSNKSCLLHPHRNPGCTPSTIEKKLHAYLTTEHVIWLNGQIEGDDTDGHMDQIARFVNPSCVVMATGPDHASLTANRQLLERAFEQIDLPLSIFELRLPDPKYADGTRLPASYVNFYIINGAVLVPAFGDSNDQRAVRILQESIPTREVISMAADKLVVGLGSFHCLTQQEPKHGN